MVLSTFDIVEVISIEAMLPVSVFTLSNVLLALLMVPGTCLLRVANNELSSLVDVVKLAVMPSTFCKELLIAGFASRVLMLDIIESSLGSIFSMVGIIADILPIAPLLRLPSMTPSCGSTFVMSLASTKFTLTLPNMSLSISAVVPSGTGISLSNSIFTRGLCCAV